MPSQAGRVDRNDTPAQFAPRQTVTHLTHRGQRSQTPELSDPAIRGEREAAAFCTPDWIRDVCRHRLGRTRALHCSANQINKWRRRRKKSEKTDCGKCAIIGEALSIDSPFVHALRCMRLPKHDGRRRRARSREECRKNGAAARYCSRVQFLVATATARKVLQ